MFITKSNWGLLAVECKFWKSHMHVIHDHCVTKGMTFPFAIASNVNGFHLPPPSLTPRASWCSNVQAAPPRSCISTPPCINAPGPCVPVKNTWGHIWPNKPASDRLIWPQILDEPYVACHETGCIVPNKCCIGPVRGQIRCFILSERLI